jgi:predicted RNA-binding protein with TRAM domain
MEEFGERRGGFGGGRRFGGGRGRGGPRRGGDDFGEKPVKVGEEYDVTIESVAEKGDGVAKIKGLVVFVPGAQKGENLRIRIKELKRKCALAEKIGEGTAPAEETTEAAEETTEAAEETTETAEETTEAAEETTEAAEETSEAPEETSEEETNEEEEEY